MTFLYSAWPLPFYLFKIFVFYVCVCSFLCLFCGLFSVTELNVFLFFFHSIIFHDLQAPRLITGKNKLS